MPKKVVLFLKKGVKIHLAPHILKKRLQKKRKKFLTRGIKCDIIPKVNQILGYSQAVRHQTLTLAFSLVRIQLPQPTQRARITRALCVGWGSSSNLTRAAGAGCWFGLAARRSTSSLVRRRASESSNPPADLKIQLCCFSLFNPRKKYLTADVENSLQKWYNEIAQ